MIEIIPLQLSGRIMLQNASQAMSQPLYPSYCGIKLNFNTETVSEKAVADILASLLNLAQLLLLSFPHGSAAHYPKGRRLHVCDSTLYQVYC